MFEFSTDRLTVRHSLKGDADRIFHLYSGRKTESYFLARKPHKSVKVTDKILQNLSNQNSWDHNAKIVLIIEEKMSMEPFGLLTLIANNHDVECHFGLSEDYSGKGYATEMLLGLVEHLMDVKAFKCVITYCDVSHKASQKVIEKSGFRFCSITKRKYINSNKNNEFADCRNYFFMLH